MPREAAEFIQRLCVAGPLLYVGLTMVLDPAGFFQSLGRLADVLGTLALRFRNDRWPMVDPANAFVPSRAPATGLRIAGVALCALALLPLTGLVD